MKKDYTTITIKVDNFTVGDYEKIRHLAIKHDVPDRASVRIVTSGLGTHVTFEWSDDVKPVEPKYKHKPTWREEPYAYPKPKDDLRFSKKL